MTRPHGEAHALYQKIANRDRTIARLEAELKDKREALALEIIAHEKTLAALKATHGSPAGAEQAFIGDRT